VKTASDFIVSQFPLTKDCFTDNQKILLLESLIELYKEKDISI